MRKLLLLEDDTALGEGIRLALKSGETEITLCRTLSEGSRALEQSTFDLLILDINLPDGSGLELLREVRQSSTVPVILLTANDMETDIVNGLESGADDFITKPFSLAVLRARVNAQLRRSTAAPSAILEIDGFSFDFDRMEFRRNGQSIDCRPPDPQRPRVRGANRGQPLTRAALVDRIWTDGAEYVDENALSVTVKRLRDKLEDVPSKPRYLKTVYGIGYTRAVK